MKAYGRFIRRILSCFRRDLSLILALVVLIGVSLAVDVLLVWPVSIMVDVVFSPRPKDDALYRGFLALLRGGGVGPDAGGGGGDDADAERAGDGGDAGAGAAGVGHGQPVLREHDPADGGGLQAD